MFGTITAQYSGYLKGLHDNIGRNHSKFTHRGEKNRPWRARFLAAGYGVFYPAANWKLGLPLAALVAADLFISGGALTALATSNFWTTLATAAGISAVSNIRARIEDRKNFNRSTGGAYEGEVWRAPQNVIDLQDAAIRGHVQGLNARLWPWRLG